MSSPDLTPRGLLGPLLRWALWSRRRVLTLAAALLIALLLLAHLGSATRMLTRTTPPAAAAAPTPYPVPAPATTSAPIPTPPPTPAGPSTAADDAAALPGDAPPQLVATTFTQRWLRHTGTAAQWLAGLQPLSTPEYGQVVLPSVDPTTVPATHLTGPASLERSEVRTEQIRIPLDTVTIRVTVVDVTGSGHWLVSDVEPDQP